MLERLRRTKGCGEGQSRRAPIRRARGDVAPPGGSPATALNDEARSMVEAFVHLPDAIVLVDGAGTIVWGNRSAERIFERSLGDWQGHSGLDLVHPDDQELVLRSLVEHPGQGGRVADRDPGPGRSGLAPGRDRRHHRALVRRERGAVVPARPDRAPALRGGERVARRAFAPSSTTRGRSSCRCRRRHGGVGLRCHHPAPRPRPRAARTASTARHRRPIRPRQVRRPRCAPPPTGRRRPIRRPSGCTCSVTTARRRCPSS